MTGTMRLHLGHAHEDRVKAELEARRWHVQPWGLGQLDEATRQALVARMPDCWWRWMPDQIAHRGNAVVLIDPKTEWRKNTPNFSIELAAWQAHLAMIPFGLEVFYVWGDMTVNSARKLRPVHKELPRPGAKRTQTNGSGTPFALVAKADQLPMDQVFGAPS